MKTSLLSTLAIFFYLFTYLQLNAFGGDTLRIALNSKGGNNSDIGLPKSNRAVVIGISTQQDSLLPDLTSNEQNAELYAAFLRSREGGLMPADHLNLLTGDLATLASFTTAIDWLDEESQMGDRISVYFAGNARLVNADNGPVPYLFFSDSPLILGRAGSMPLAKICYRIQEIARKKNLHYNLIFDLYLGSTSVMQDDQWRQWLEAIKNSFPYADIEETLDKTNNSKKNHSGYSPILLDGLTSQADLNDDLKIMPREVAKHLRNQHKKAPGGYVMLIAFSDENTEIAKVDDTRGLRNTGKGYSDFPSIMSRDMSNLEDSLLSGADERTRQWYFDFMLTKKLGKLMEPAGRCTSDLYDSLLSQPSIRPLHSHLRRQLAASLQDETQQALNDYLRTDTRELQRRWKHGGNYAAYPKYMSRVVELLGEKHFMHAIIECKKFYFEGLTARLDFEKSSDSLLLHEAIEKQTFALEYEPEAAFVLNELGILHLYLGSDSAKTHFLHAINLAPQWGVPYLNISIVHFRKSQLDSALFYAHTAVNLTPWNPVAVSHIGVVYLNMKRYAEADIWLRRAASIDPSDALNYYNLSCTKAMQGDTKAAIQWMELAFKYGFTDIDHLNKDEDLIELRESAKYDRLLRKYFPK